MQFNTIEYFFFLPVVVAVYYLAPYAWRWLWLILASLYFLSFNPWFIIPVAAVALVEYIIALLIAGTPGERRSRRTMLFLAGIASPLALLVLFKYAPFFYDAVFHSTRFLHKTYPSWLAHLIIPLGISYYSFQCISYIVEVHRGSIPPERHVGIFILYLLFFPKIAAGPIERPGFITQFRERHDPDYRGMTGGLKLLALGLFKKTVIADRVGMVVNEVYGHPGHYHGIYFLLATFFFAVQLYADFSGYTDMARGSARLLGFRLMENFRRPYGAGSVAEFWRRWHISLTTWFRDYLYIPLGGNRVAKGRHAVNIMTTFILSGLWHGANWTFVAWGAFHGSCMVIGQWTGAIRRHLAEKGIIHRAPGLHRIIQTAATGILVLFAWIFFRSATLSDAVHVYGTIFSGLVDIGITVASADTARLTALTDIARGNLILGFSREAYRPEMLIAVLSILFLWFFNTLEERCDVWELLSGKSWVIRWAFYFFLVAGIVFFGMFTKDQFIYFRF